MYRGVCNGVLQSKDITIEGTTYKDERCYGCLRNKLGFCRSCPSPLPGPRFRWCVKCRKARDNKRVREYARRRYREDIQKLRELGIVTKKVTKYTDPIDKALRRKWFNAWLEKPENKLKHKVKNKEWYDKTRAVLKEHLPRRPKKANASTAA